MTYSLITGGEKWTQVASIAGWKTFREWVEEIESDDIDELRHLVEYGWSQKLPDLSEQLTETLSSGKPSADVKDIGQTVLAALEDAPDGAESAVLTDGLASIDDPDDSGWSSTEEEDDEPAEPDSGKGIESGDIETPEGIPPPLSRKAIEKAHVARVSKREEEASRDLARFFQGYTKAVAQRVAKSGFKPDPSKDARKQADQILKKAFDPQEHLKGLVRAIAPHLAASFCVGAGAELELTKQAAIRKKARGWTGEKYSPDQPRDEAGRFGEGSGTSSESGSTDSARAETYNSVLSEGIESGKENVVILNREGKAVGRASGDKDTVDPPSVEGLDTPGAALELVHNHPDNRGLSPVDLKAFAKYRGVDTVTAVAHDKTVYSATVTGDRRELDKAVSAYVGSVVEKVAEWVDQYETLTPEIRADIRQRKLDELDKVGEAMQAAGFVKLSVSKLGDKSGKSAHPSGTKYDPGQPRDEAGRFGSGGGSGESTGSESMIVEPSEQNKKDEER